MRFITRETDYSVRALVFIARKQKKSRRRAVSVRELAKVERLPRDFMRRLLQQLAKAGLLTSTKGRGGGFALTRPAEKIRVGRIRKLYQGPVDLTHCFVGTVICPRRKKCKFRKSLLRINRMVEGELDKITIGSLF